MNLVLFWKLWPPEDARHYGKLTLAVDERKYTAAPPAVKGVLSVAAPLKSVGLQLRRMNNGFTNYHSRSAFG